MLLPGHTFLYSPPVTKIKSLLEAGELGDLYFISMSRVNLGLHQSDVSVIWILPRTTSRSSPTGSARCRPRSRRSRAAAYSRTSPTSRSWNMRYDDVRRRPPRALLALTRQAPPDRDRRLTQMLVYDDTSTEPIASSTPWRRVAPTGNLRGVQALYRTGDIVSPKVEPTEPLALEIADFC